MSVESVVKICARSLLASSALRSKPVAAGQMGVGSWKLLMRPQAAGAVVALAAAATTLPEGVCLPSAAAEAQESAPISDTDRFRGWLEANGADISRIDFRESKLPGSGLGVFLADGQKSLRSRQRAWWAPFRRSTFATIAEFPMSLALTADNILSQHELGKQYQWLVQHGVLDERDIVQCYLAVERACEANSSMAPWIALLPKEFHSPLCWSHEELNELRGTSLYNATLGLRKRLQDKWRELHTPLTEIAIRLKAPRSPTLDDLIWAHCVFWSRGCSLPVPKQSGAASEIVALAARKNTSPQPLLTIHEGIVPGLDFANHLGDRANGWYEVVQPRDPPPGEAPQRPLSTARVRLQLHYGSTLRGGDEVTINYGDSKSNEELLFLYGFVDPAASAIDTLMVACPVPPVSQWDDVMRARIDYLMRMGLPRQFFLKSTGGDGTSDPDKLPKPPQEALEAIEVFVLTPEELKSRIQTASTQLQAHRTGQTDAGLQGADLSGAALDLDALSRDLNRLRSQPVLDHLQLLERQLGLRLASVSTYVKLLEVRLLQLEDNKEGTGSMEDDDRLLAQHKATLPTPTTTTTGRLPYRKWCALVYRRGQKAIVREHLAGARHELQRVLSLVAEMPDLIQKAEGIKEKKKA